MTKPIKKYRSGLAKCSALWNAAGRPKPAEVIPKHIGIKPRIPCTTSWNSLYDSLCVINDKKFVIIQAMTELKIVNFTENNFKVID